MDTSALSRYDAAALAALLPHRYPFLLVDYVDVLDPGRVVRGVKRVTGSECQPAFGAPPGTPIMPFPLVLEALAQTSGALMPDLMAGTPGGTAYFMGADRVRIRHAAGVGDMLQLDIRLTHWRRGVCRTRGVATAGDRLVMTAELVTIIRARA